jgi:hypothetical protein
MAFPWHQLPAYVCVEIRDKVLRYLGNDTGRYLKGDRHTRLVLIGAGSTAAQVISGPGPCVEHPVCILFDGTGCRAYSVNSVPNAVCVTSAAASTSGLLGCCAGSTMLSVVSSVGEAIFCHDSAGRWALRSTSRGMIE